MNRESAIVILDDSHQDLCILRNLLKGKGYVIHAFSNPYIAIDFAISNPPDLFITALLMKQMDGFTVFESLYQNERTKMIPVLFATREKDPEVESHCFDIGCVDYIKKPINPHILHARVKNQLHLQNQAKHLETLVDERTQEILEIKYHLIRSLGRASEYKDNETGTHILRMSEYSYIIARAMGISADVANTIRMAASMHDVGKIGIPDGILLKPGKLNKTEWEIMKSHCLIGGEIIGCHPSKLLRKSRTIALTHHEKWDGNGYPAGLSGENIPLSSRIVSIADVFDALTNERAYKNAWSSEEAINYIINEKGFHFDPFIVEAFLESIQEIQDIKQKYGTDRYEKMSEKRLETELDAI